MSHESLSFSGLALMLVLGLRHGLDPDHIAIIDALSLRLQQQRPRWAAWTGSFFALGHGAVVTLIAVAVSLGAQAVSIPPQVYAVTQWIPVVLLLVMGLINLRGLLSRRQYRHAGWAARLLPERLMRVSHPIGVIVVGAAFAAIFDTITQASAWGYIATEQGGVTAAWLAGGAFTLGMICTDTLDSQMLCRLLRHGDAETLERRQRRLGWVIVTLSFGVVLYSVAQHLWPDLALDERSYTLLGVLAVSALAAVAWRVRSHPDPLSHHPNP